MWQSVGDIISDSKMDSRVTIIITTIDSFTLTKYVTDTLKTCDSYTLYL